MTAPTRTFRLFVSSTFSDLHTERDALQTKVFPRLRRLCAAQGASFEAVDLRWGVSQDAAEAQQTMRICLREIERCRRVTRQPNFIVLLGDRYGWRPVPEEIPASDFERIRSHLQGTENGCDGRTLLSRWYRLDKNAVPAVYRLLPWRGACADFNPWRDVENQISGLLRTTVAALGFSSEQQRPYTASAVEQEIARRGLLDATADEEDAFFFVRSVEGLPADRNAREFVDLDGEDQPDPEARDRLANLKDRLRQRFPDKIYQYRSVWKEKGPSTAHLRQLCADAYACLSEIILKELAEGGEVDPIAAERRAHHVFAKDRSHFFVGREAPLEIIQTYLSRPSAQPLVIIGPSGSGKSTLMARALLDARDTDAAAYRFIGAVLGSSNPRGLLEGLCRELRRHYGEDEAEVPNAYPELVEEFRALLGAATSEKRLILFLDALDQLSPLHNRYDFSWVPTELPPNVHLVVSASPGDCLEALQHHVPEAEYHQLAPMPIDQGRQLLELWLADAGRTLQAEQWRRVLEAFERAQGLPLYLRLAFEEARRWRSDGDQVELAENIPGLIRDLFARLSRNTNHGEILVSLTLAYLAAGKNGLSHDELLDVLSADTTVIVDFRTRSPQSPRTHALPLVVWSRLYYDLAPYLTERHADGVNSLDFFHRQLRDVVEMDYLAGDTRRERHRALAEYFGAQPHAVGAAGHAAPNLRKLSELPFQLAHGERWEGLDRLLTDFGFVRTKVAAFGPQPMVEDFNLPDELDHTAAMQATVGDLRHLELIREALRLSAHVLDQDPAQLSGQLLGRLPSDKQPRLQRLRKEASRWRGSAWLRPLAPTLLGPGGPLTRTIPAGSGSGETLAVTPSGQQVVAPFENNNIRIWDLGSGAAVLTLRGHRDLVRALAITADGAQAVSVAEDKSLRVWDLRSGAAVMSLQPPGLSALAVDVDPQGKWVLYSLEEHPLMAWAPTSGKEPQMLRGHTGLVRSIAISQDGRWASSCAWDKTIRLWELETGRALRVLADQDISGESLAISPDGQWLLGGLEDCRIGIWDVRSGKLVGTLSGHDNVVRALAVTADGRRAVSASRDKTVRVWDLHSQSLVRTLSGHTDEVGALALLPNGRTLLSADRKLRVWDLHSGEILRTLEGHANLVECIAVSPDGRFAVSTSGDQTLKLWDLESGVEMCVPAALSEPVLAAAIASDGTLVAAAEETLAVWALDRAERLSVLKRPELSGQAVAVSPDGRLILATTLECPLQMRELTTGAVVRTLRGHTGLVREIVVTPNGRRALSAAWDGTVRLWDLESGRTVRSLRGHGILGETAAISADGQRALVPCEDHAATLWNLQSGNPLRRLSGHAQWIDAVAFTPDGKRGLTGSRDRTLKLWDLDSGAALSTLRGHTNTVNAVVVTGDGRHAVSSSIDRTLRVWDLDAQSTAGVSARHDDYVRAVAITPDGALAVTASDDGTLKTWEVGSGRARSTLRGHSGEVWALAVMPNSRQAVSGARDHVLQIWDLLSGRAETSLRGHEEAVTAIVISSTGQQAVSASYDETVRLWDLTNGRLIHTFRGHVNLVTNVAMTPDAQRAVSASLDGTLRIWDLDSGAALFALEGHPDGVEAVAVSPDGKWVVSCGLNDACLRIWDLSTGEALAALRGASQSYGALQVTPDLRRLISASSDPWDARVDVWDLQAQERLTTIPQAHADTISALVLAPDGQTAVSTSSDHSLKLWDLHTGSRVSTFTADGGLTRVAIAPNGRTLVAGEESGEVHRLRLSALRR